MSRGPKGRQRTWVAGVGLVVLVLLAAGGGAAVAKARNDRPGGSNARPWQALATSTTSAGATAAALATKGHKRPRPTTTTTSPSTTTTTSPSTTTTTPGSAVDVQLPLPRFSDMQVDEAHGRLYITGGKGTGAIVVTDLDGSNLRTIDGYFKGAAGMTLSPDGTKLDVALSDSDGIAIIDTATYAVDFYYVGTHDGVPTCPRDLAWASGQLWFSWGCDNAPAGIGRVDPDTGAYDLNAYTADTRIITPPLLATLPSQPNMLIAGETGSNPANLFRFEATPTRLEQRVWRRTDGGSVFQLAVTPDGSQVIVPSGSPYYHEVLRTSDLTLAYQYPTTAYPNAAAIRSDGLVAAGVNAAYDKDVYIFEPGGSAPIATYEFGHLPNQETWAHTLANGGLAWAGDRIYAVTQVSSEPGSLMLRIRLVD